MDSGRSEIISRSDKSSMIDLLTLPRSRRSSLDKNLPPLAAMASDSAALSPMPSIELKGGNNLPSTIWKYLASDLYRSRCNKSADLWN